LVKKGGVALKDGLFSQGCCFSWLCVYLGEIYFTNYYVSGGALKLQAHRHQVLVNEIKATPLPPAASSFPLRNLCGRCV